jgi:hypothetical protein
MNKQHNLVESSLPFTGSPPEQLRTSAAAATGTTSAQLRLRKVLALKLSKNNFLEFNYGYPPFIKYNDYLLKLAILSITLFIELLRYFKLGQKYDIETVLKTLNSLNFNLYCF